MQRATCHTGTLVALVMALLLFCAGSNAWAQFESGSTCGAAFLNSTTCRGAFNPTVNTTVQLPPSGILDYSTVYIPQGVTVRFAKNAANTPVIIRTSGNFTLEGIIDITGSAGIPGGTAGDGFLGDDGQPGVGGPGGYDGGWGGRSPLFGGSNGAGGGPGQGPGGGNANPNCTTYNNSTTGCAGGGGAYSTSEGGGWYQHASGATYGQPTLLPLVGGSGGGGGNAGGNYNGSGGGGGGGAILIACSGTMVLGKSGVNSTGYIIADGGTGGPNGGDSCGGPGGGGSGGGIRIVADTITRIQQGGLYARRGGNAGSCSTTSNYGGYGRIRIEANSTNWSGWTDPGYSFSTPSKVLVPNSPTLLIASVAGQAVPANPTGAGDVTLPQGTTTATVTLAATNIPRGTTVTIYVVPSMGAGRSSVLSSALDGPSDAATTATANVNLSPGNNVLLASATYTVTELLAMSLPRFDGEYVAKIRVDTDMNGQSQVTYITASGKEYPAPKV